MPIAVCKHYGVQRYEDFLNYAKILASFVFFFKKNDKIFAYVRKKQYLCTRFSQKREGELSEWSKEPHSKCGIRITSYRGFESLTLRKRCTSMVYSVRFIKSGKNRVKNG